MREEIDLLNRHSSKLDPADIGATWPPSEVTKAPRNGLINIIERRCNLIANGDLGSGGGRWDFELCMRR